MWFWLSLLSALLVAVKVGVRKKALTFYSDKGLSYTVGSLSYLFAGAMLAVIYYLRHGTLAWSGELSHYGFWAPLLVHIVLEIIAVSALHEATILEDISYITPHTALYLIPMVFLMWIITGEAPSASQGIGIAILLLGVVIINFKAIIPAEDTQKRKKALGFLAVTIICWAATPILRKQAISASSPDFFAYVLHLSVGAGFLIPFLVFREKTTVASLVKSGKLPIFLLFVGIMAGITGISNLLAYASLSQTDVASAMAVKETAPVFVFLIGYVFFGERRHVFRNAIASAMVAYGDTMLAKKT